MRAASRELSAGGGAFTDNDLGPTTLNLADRSTKTGRRIRKADRFHEQVSVMVFAAVRAIEAVEAFTARTRPHAPTRNSAGSASARRPGILQRSRPYGRARHRDQPKTFGVSTTKV